MNQNLTELVFILDRSGSMAGLESDTIGGFNSMIENQKNEPGEARVTTVVFDNEYKMIHDAIDIKEIAPLTRKDYYVGGMTALMDAVGHTINHIGRRLAYTPEAERPGQVIVMITTDGYENASHEFTRDKVKSMIEHQTNIYSWKFMFLGANIDAAREAQSIGISQDFAAQYTASEIGTKSVYCCMDAMVSSMRSCDAVDTTLSACYAAAEKANTIDDALCSIRSM